MSLAERLKNVIIQKVAEEKRYKDLAELTSVGAGSWRQFFDGKQRPTMQMIEAICTLWPQYAFWIATGIEDSESGHIAAKAKFDLEETIENQADTEYFSNYIKLAGTGTKSSLDLSQMWALLYEFQNEKFAKMAYKVYPKKNLQLSQFGATDEDTKLRKQAILLDLKHARNINKKISKKSG